MVNSSERPVPKKKGTARIAVLLADPQNMFRAGVRAILAKSLDMHVVGEARSAAEALKQAAALLPDVLVTSTFMPDAPEGGFIHTFCQRYPSIAVLVLTTTEGCCLLAKALGDGAKGLITKDADAQLVAKAIRAVYAGERWIQRELAYELVEALRTATISTEPLPEVTNGTCLLSRREREVLVVFAEGNAPGEVALKLGISPSTVRVHLMRIQNKLGLRNHLEAVHYAIRQGLVEP